MGSLGSVMSGRFCASQQLFAISSPKTFIFPQSSRGCNCFKAKKSCQMLQLIKSHCAPMRPGIGNGVCLIAPSCALGVTSTSGNDCLARIYRVA